MTLKIFFGIILGLDLILVLMTVDKAFSSRVGKDGRKFDRWDTFAFVFATLVLVLILYGFISHSI